MAVTRNKVVQIWNDADACTCEKAIIYQARYYSHTYLLILTSYAFRSWISGVRLRPACFMLKKVALGCHCMAWWPWCCRIRRLWPELTCWKMQQLLCSSTKFKQFFLRIVHTSNLLQEIHQYLLKVMMIKSGSSGGVVNSLIVCYWLTDFFDVDQSKEIDLSAGIISWFKFRSRILHGQNALWPSEACEQSRVLVWVDHQQLSLSVCPCWGVCASVHYCSKTQSWCCTRDWLLNYLMAFWEMQALGFLNQWQCVEESHLKYVKSCYVGIEKCHVLAQLGFVAVDHQQNDWTKMLQLAEWYSVCAQHECAPFRCAPRELVSCVSRYTI